MAFLQQPSSYFAQASEVSPSDLFQQAGQAPLFTPLELTVIRLACRETIGSAREHGLVRKWIGRLFDLPPANGLADERLEALRRFAILARHRSGDVAKRLPAFLACGFTPLQAGALASGFSG
jgi:hypothetical protein